MAGVVERTVSELQQEIETFEARREELEKYYLGKFVLIHGGDLVGAYDTLDAVAAVAIPKFGRGPYLIRKVGEPPMYLPASVMTFGAKPAHAAR